MQPTTYHITWTTYGTWLPGDARGWVGKKLPGIQAPDPEREQQAHGRMTEDTVILDSSQRAVVEQSIRDHCRIRNWTLHAANVRTNHVHVVETADRKPDEVMKQLKAWCSRRLSDASGLDAELSSRNGRKRWFTEGGDVELIGDDEYFHNAVQYVLEGQ